jgi:hypothetical protein
MKRICVVLVFLLLLPGATFAEVMYVKVAKTRLLSRASAFSKTKATLKYRTKVTVLVKKGAYFKVRTKQGTGYLPKRSLLVKKPRYSSRLKGKYVSSDEVALATKGFNEQVESDYKHQHRDLPYAELDQLEKDTTYKDVTKTFRSFRKKGKLGEYQEGGAQ